jgi:hypothetical protein
MAQIAINVSKLSIAAGLVRGQEIINLSTDNPAVPGNAALLTVLSSAQTALDAANVAFEEARQNCRELKSDRDDKLAAWRNALTGLAAFTESATGGDATKILSTGFAIKAQPVPPNPVEQILNVRVSFNGEPGKSIVNWKADASADAYRVQCCQDPIEDDGWEDMGVVAEPKFTGNGAIPGKKCWYRVAGVNRLGQGPWSEPALRPVM